MSSEGCRAHRGEADRRGRRQCPPDPGGLAAPSSTRSSPTNAGRGAEEDPAGPRDRGRSSSSTCIAMPRRRCISTRIHCPRRVRPARGAPRRPGLSGRRRIRRRSVRRGVQPPLGGTRRDDSPDRPIPLACHSTTLEFRGERDVDHELAGPDAAALVEYLTLRGIDRRKAARRPAGALRRNAAGGLRAGPGAGLPASWCSARCRRRVEGGRCGRRDRRSADRRQCTQALSGPSDGVMFARILLRFVTAGKRIAKVAGGPAPGRASFWAPEPSKRKAACEGGLSIVGSAVRSRPRLSCVTHQSRQRPRSRSRQPGTAGYDNETLDHLLSLLTGNAQYGLRRATYERAGRCGVLSLSLVS